MSHDLYEEQLKLEKSMIQYGQDRYKTATAVAEENGRGSETSYARRLLSVVCKDAADAIEAFVTKRQGPGRVHVSKKILAMLDSEQAAYITLKSIFDSLIREEPLVGIALTIGQRIEDQIRFTAFQEEHPDLYQHIVREFKDRNVVSYKRKHVVLTNVHNRYGKKWKGLATNHRVLLGSKLIELIIQATGMFQIKHKRIGSGGRKSTNVLTATPDTIEWIDEHIHRFALLYPDFSPTVLPPKPWTSLTNGGYYLDALRKRCPFIKTRQRGQRKAVNGHDYSETMKAVNKIQETPWRINQFVLSTMQEVWRRNLRIGMPPSEPHEIPPFQHPDIKKEDMTEQQLEEFKFWKKEVSDIYTMEKQRASKCMLLSRVMSSAIKYTKYEEFYFVYNCDFRGRIYAASSGFSPQGPDISKGILEFATGRPLGQSGFRWLCIHGANVFGFDKASYQERYEWCLERKEQLIQIGKDAFAPGAVKIWGDADKPYQFLAFCREFAQAIDDQEGFVSHLPIALDGSCNGLQHFSAILRDEVGGKAVNLVPSSRPQDIYAEVAKVVQEKLKRYKGTDKDPLLFAQHCINFGVDRKICKKPVMTLPYGSTQRNCVIKTTEFLNENIERLTSQKEDLYKVGRYLGDVIWSSIDDVVVAARQAMNWLRTTSKIISKLNKPIIWNTPTNFLVYQGMMEQRSQLVRTQLLGDVRFFLSVDTDKISLNKQANGISPNFVHSLDASHLIMTVNNTDVDSFAMIHDSFGTHACDTEKLAFSIREQFIKLYTENDVLQDLKDSIEKQFDIELPELPELGKLDVNNVMQSDYFFS